MVPAGSDEVEKGIALAFLLSMCCRDISGGRRKMGRDMMKEEPNASIFDRLGGGGEYTHKQIEIR